MMRSNLNDDVFECLKVRGLTIDLREVPAELRRRYKSIRVKGRDDQAQQLKKVADDLFIEEILRRAFVGAPRAG